MTNTDDKIKCGGLMCISFLLLSSLNTKKYVSAQTEVDPKKVICLVRNFHNRTIWMSQKSATDIFEFSALSSIRLKFILSLTYVPLFPRASTFGFTNTEPETTYRGHKLWYAPLRKQQGFPKCTSSAFGQWESFRFKWLWKVSWERNIVRQKHSN